MKTRSLTLLGFIMPVALLAATFGLYLTTLAPGMLRGDSGEFQWAMASLNVAHATGYPLFTLIGYGWLQLPLPGAAAWRLNLLAPIFGAAAVVMLFVLARSLTRRADAALAGAVLLAVAPVFWFNASILEVYTLNALFLAVVLYALWRWSACAQEQRGGNNWLYFAFFALGLSLAHHRLMVLTLPGILVFILLVDRHMLFNWRRLVALVLALLPGLLLYVYVPLRLLPTGATLDYAIYDIILGREYAGSLMREFHPLQVLWEIPARNLHIGLALGLFGLICLLRSQRNFAILLLLVYLGDVAFTLVYSVPDVEVFLTPSFVVVALLSAVGFAGAIDWFTERLGTSRVRLLAPACALLLLAASFFGLTYYPVVRAQVVAEAGTQEQRARALLASNLPPGSLLELDWETATAIRFIQTVEGTRPDLEARLIKVNTRDEFLWVLRNVDAGRPVFVEKGVKWTRAPASYRVTSAWNDLAQITRVPVEPVKVGAAIDDKIELSALQMDSKGVGLYWQVHSPLGRDLATFIHFFDEEGKPLGQEDHAACCEAIYGYRTGEWEPGRPVADSFRPAPAGTVYMQIGLYSVKADEIEPYGRTVYLQTRPVILPEEARPIGIQLGEGIVARAYELQRKGEDIAVTLFWESRTPTAADYKVFVHLLDTTGKIIDQVDRQPLDGVYPTSAWEAGQIVRDPMTLKAAPGASRIVFGLYGESSQQRLPRVDGQGDTISIELSEK